MNNTDKYITFDELRILAETIGFSHVAAVDMNAMQPMEDIRAMCSEDRCGNYNKSWSCPPSPVCGTPSEMADKMRQYSRGILVQYTGQMEDDFDLGIIRETEKKHKQMFDTFVRQIRFAGIPCLPMSSGGCTRCFQCTWPDRPCRYPKKLYPSMEAYGLWVSDVCVKSGTQYNYGKNTITFTACVLYDRKENI